MRVESSTRPGVAINATKSTLCSSESQGMKVDDLLTSVDGSGFVGHSASFSAASCYGVAVLRRSVGIQSAVHFVFFLEDDDVVRMLLMSRIRYAAAAKGAIPLPTR